MSSLLEVGGLLGLAAAAGYWLEAMRSKELARAAGKRACEQAPVQFLDDTVELVRVRVRRDDHGRLGFYREYRFEFSDDGADVNTALFDREGNPRLELYQEDKLHFKPHAYAEFAAVIKPIIAKAWGK